MAKIIRRRGSSAREFRLVVLLGVGLGWAISAWQEMPLPQVPAIAPAPSTAATVSFAICHTGGGINCVVDGDTFWLAGEKVRIADVDTPETHPARCAREAALGERATRRLRDLLSAGPVALEAIDRATDRYGRRLAIVHAGGVPVGETLIAEGLARRWGGPRRSWCDQV